MVEHMHVEVKISRTGMIDIDDSVYFARVPMISWYTDVSGSLPCTLSKQNQ